MTHIGPHARVMLVLALVIAVAAFSAIAQEQRPGDQPQPLQKQFASKGCIELGGSVSFMWAQPVSAGKTSDATVSFSFMPYGGYFITEGFELGVNPLGVTIEHRPATSSGSATTTTQLTMFFAPSYNFKVKANLYPFIEGLAGYTADITTPNEGNSVTIGGFSWGGRVGLKLPVVERGLLVIGVQYVAITMNPSGQTDRNGSNQLSVNAGFSIWM